MRVFADELRAAIQRGEVTPIHRIGVIYPKMIGRLASREVCLCQGTKRVTYKVASTPRITVKLEIFRARRKRLLRPLKERLRPGL